MKKAPPYLVDNHTIGICCPSGFLETSTLEKAITLFQQNNWKIILGKTTKSLSANYFSGTDEERLEDFQTMLDNPEIKCIVFGRGGYGISRIIDKINWTNFIKNPKWICGFSDITLLHCHINRNFNVQTLHSPMAKNLKEEETDLFYIKNFIETLKGNKQEDFIFNSPFVISPKDTISAEIVGGNLALIAHSIGSNSEIQTEDKILFLEDVGEYLYNIDRMFLQLKRTGKLNGLKALILGGFTGTKDTQKPFGKTFYELIQEHCKEYLFPIVFDFPIGHQKENYSIKIGCTYSLNIKEKKIHFYDYK